MKEAALDSTWRGFVMWLGICALVVCGYVVGAEYCNRTLREIFDEK